MRARDTATETMDRTMTILTAAGKHPVRVEKDVPGFVANRLQHALWREAISIVEHGIADAATVDECVRYGFGLRLPILGPMENADMVGLDLTLSIHDYILSHIERFPGAVAAAPGEGGRGRTGFQERQRIPGVDGGAGAGLPRTAARLLGRECLRDRV